MKRFSVFTGLVCLLVLTACGENRSIVGAGGEDGGAAGELPAGVRPPARWSGAVRVPPVGPEGSPKAKGLPARPMVPVRDPLVVYLKLQWETPRGTRFDYIEYGWQSRHVTKCEQSGANVRIVVARQISDRAQEVTLTLPAAKAGSGQDEAATFVVSLPKGIAVQAETGDTLRSDDKKPVMAKFEIVDGRVRGTFHGRVEGELTREGYQASGSFDCELAPAP